MTKYIKYTDTNEGLRKLKIISVMFFLVQTIVLFITFYLDTIIFLDFVGIPICFIMLFYLLRIYVLFIEVEE